MFDESGSEPSARGRGRGVGAALGAELRASRLGTRFRAEEEVTTAESLEALPKRSPYGEYDYWEKRYRSNSDADEFDWLCGADELCGVVTSVVGSKQIAGKVLHVGCGTSSVGAELIRRGICEHVVNLDTSASCVERMRLKFEDIRGCEFQVGDACHMEHLGDETFEVVLDKGTLDALACKEGGEEARLEAGRALVAESHRVLRPGGSLVIASFGQPETRWRYLRDSGGGVDWAHAAHESVRVAATGSELHVYSLTKPRKQDRALPLDSRRRHMFDVATWAVGVAFCAVAITLALNSNRQKRAATVLLPAAPFERDPLEAAPGTAQCNYDVLRSFAHLAASADAAEDGSSKKPHLAAPHAGNPSHKDGEASGRTPNATQPSRRPAGLRWSLGAGTLLGAMRTEPPGLLRWEHDVDIYLPAADAFELLRKVQKKCLHEGPAGNASDAEARSEECGSLEYRGLVDRDSKPCCGFGFKLFHADSDACELDVLVLASATHAPLVHQETVLWPFPWGPYYALAREALRQGGGHGPEYFVIPEDVAHKQLMLSEANWWRRARSEAEWEWLGPPVSFFHGEYFKVEEYLPLHEMEYYDFKVNIPHDPWASLNRTYGDKCGHVARLDERGAASIRETHGGFEADLRLPEHFHLKRPAAVVTAAAKAAAVKSSFWKKQPKPPK